MESELKKNKTLKNDIIFVDGLWGSGKSLIAPIVCAMSGVEKQKFEHIYEYLCVLRHLNKIDIDAAETLLKIYADLSQYNNLIGREVNLRWSDVSGPANNLNSFRYIRRMFGREGDKVLEEINHQNLALNILSHIIMPVANPLIQAYGSRLKIIEIVRHPVYMVQHWSSYLSRFDSEREFTICFEHKGQKIPWFAHTWQNKFIDMSVMDRSLSSIIFLYDLLFKSINNLSNKSNNIMVISFESLVMNTEKELKRLQHFLDRSHSSKINKILKQQKIPRNILSQGKAQFGYGWKKSTSVSEKQEYDNQFQYIRENASKNVLLEFNELIMKYNKNWPSILSNYQ